MSTVQKASKNLAKTLSWFEERIKVEFHISYLFRKTNYRKLVLMNEIKYKAIIFYIIHLVT